MITVARASTLPEHTKAIALQGVAALDRLTDGHVVLVVCGSDSPSIIPLDTLGAILARVGCLAQAVALFVDFGASCRIAVGSRLPLHVVFFHIIEAVSRTKENRLGLVKWSLTDKKVCCE